MTTPMLRSVLLLPLAASGLIAANQSLDLTSPDGSVRVRLVTAADGHLLYSVSSRGQARLESAPAGVILDQVVSPWRVLVLGQDLNALVNSDVIAALCDPPDPMLFPDGPNASWIKPGKAPCTWMVYGNDGAQWDRQKWFVDVSAATGCEYLLVDAGWRTEKWGWLKNGGDLWARAAELCRYAAERQVGIV